MQTNQTPEALAKVITTHLQLCIDDPMWPNHFEMHKDTARLFIRNINRLRDMAASRAKECAALQRDAERYQWLREQPHAAWNRISWNTWGNDPSVWPARDAEIDAAIAATKRGGA